MADKLLKYDVAMKSTKTVWQMETPRCYTGDENTVTFDFNITDLLEADLVGVVPNVYLYMRDGSFFQIGPADGVTTTGTKVNYTMKGNEGKHSGIARAQLVLVWDDEINPPEKLTSQLYDFEVVSGLENKVAVEVMIQDWTTLTREARTFIDTSSDEVDALKGELQTAINTANASLGEFDVALETGIVAANLAEKLEDFEEINNSRLLSTERQLAEAEITLAGIDRTFADTTYATLAALQTAYPTGDTKRYIVAADGKWYWWNGTAWTAGQVAQAIGIADKSVFKHNLSQPLQDYFELYKSYKNVGVSYKGTSDPGNRTWYGLAMLCHSVAVFTKIGIRLTPLNLMGTEYTAELRSGANFNTLLATATGVKQTNGYEFVTFDFGKNFFGDVYVCIKTAYGQAPSLDASFLNTSMVTTTDQRYNIASPGGAWVALSGGYNAYLKIDFYTDEYAVQAQNLLSRVRQVESEILMRKNDLFSPLMHTILGIGDSLTAGAYDLDALTTTIYPNASYLAMISRLKNVAIVNKGSSGSTTNDYRTLHDADIVACNASAVVIWLGVNDVLKGANAFNGSVADVQGSDYTLFPNTSAGNLGYIIKRAKARNPNAKIFVCNMLKWFNGGTVVKNLNAANVTIAAVADYLDAHLIDLNTLSGLSYALNRDQCFGVRGVHLTEYGYAIVANTVTNVITDVIKNNLADFRYTNMALN